MQRIMRLASAACIVVLALAIMPALASAQGVTSGGIGGTVMGPQNAPISGATIKIFSPTTGSVRTVLSRTNGKYTATGLEVGSYRVSVVAIGYGPKAVEEVRVSLSQMARVDFELEQKAVTVQELVTKAPPSTADFAPTRTGALTYVSDSTVRRLPTLNRQLQDFVKLTPQVTTNPDPNSSGELSIGGQNSRFNAIQVDGTTQNDRFGLGSTGELGGQANGRGISLEAVKEYQVVVSPYNVTQGGFTGGLINAVTKNGTNELKATAFYTMRSQDLVPDVPLYKGSLFNVKQFGGSLGGPIVKDKLQFFVSGELNRGIKPAGGPYIGQPQDAGSQLRVDQALIDRFNAALKTYGIDGGSAGAVDNENPITNLVARLDYKLGENNRLVLRNIYNNSKGDDFSRSSATFFLTSNRFKRSEHANSLALQLFSNFGGGAANEFELGWIRQRFARSFDALGPQVSVINVPSPVVSGALVKLVAGPDSNSHINQLDQDFFELRNDFTVPMGNGHLVTVGTRSDFYKVRNAFWQNAFGSWVFSSMANLEAGIAQAYGVGVGVGDPVARFKSLNLSFYAQDQWSLSKNLTLTYGLRAEAPVMLDKPTPNDSVDAYFARKTADVPSNWTFNPRVGFNWDVKGTNQTQLRGGAGMFAGTPPYVWLSNLYTTNGINGVSQVTCDGLSGRPAAPAFNATNAASPPQGCGGSLTIPGAVNTIDPNYKQTQLMRATLGIDRQLGRGFTASLDGLYSYSLKQPFMVNLALADPVGTDYAGRVMYGTLAASTGIPTQAFKNTKYKEVYDLQNSKGDYSYSISAGLKKRFAGSFDASANYSYQRSYSVGDFTSSVASSNFRNQRTLSGNQFDQRTDPSAFDRPHRVTASVSWTAPWKNYPTDVSFFYQGQSGTTFTYTYGGSSSRGDVNADGVTTNDPIYIPTSASEMNFAVNGAVSIDSQKVMFNKLMDGLPCMKAQSGHIMKRDSCRNPWFNQLDFSIRQSLPSTRGHKLTVQADIYNFLNFLNSDWGQYRQNNRFPQVTALTVTGKTADNKPIVTFNPLLGTLDGRFPVQLNTVSYWQGQLSLRYAY